MMKHYIYNICMLLAVVILTACSQSEIEEVSNDRLQSIDKLTVSFEGCDNDTRIQLNEEVMTVWNKDDLVSVFFQSATNEKWQYQGEDGTTRGDIAETMDYQHEITADPIVVVYPYDANYTYDINNGTISATLPAVQQYKENSYGDGGNIMVASGLDEGFTLKNSVGWLRFHLTGAGEVIKSVTITATGGEALAGDATIDTTTAALTMNASDSVISEISLNCGEGVELSEEVTKFYIALPPQRYSQGIQVKVNCLDNVYMFLGTEEAFTIERNHIKPIDCGEFHGRDPLSNEIIYATNDGNKIELYHPESFDANVIEESYDVATGMGKIVFDKPITTIPKNTFGLCETITVLVIPEGVEVIEENAFTRCTSLKEIVIPSTVKSFGNAAFYECTGCLKIDCDIPDATATKGCFTGSKFTEIVFEDFASRIGTYAFYNLDTIEKITFGNGTFRICSNAFEGCDNLKEVVFGENIEVIDYRSFFNCDSLTDIVILDSTLALGTEAFAGCDNLANVTIGSGIVETGSSVFANCKAKLTVNSNIPDSSDIFDNSQFSEVTFGDGVTYIGADSFYNLDSITNVTFGNGDFAIGTKAFYDCSAITDVTFGSGNSTIGESAFYGCIKLTNVDLGNVSSIDREAFRFCGLKKIVLPESVSHIGYAAFRSCSDLVWVECLSTTPSEVSLVDGKWEAFDGNAKDRKIFIPDGAIRSYSLEDGWEEYIDYLTVVNDNLFSLRYTTNDNQPINLSVIDGFGAAYYDATFDEATGEGAILFDASPTTIPDNAFKEMTNLTSIIIPDSVTSIGAYAFYECSSLTSVTIPDSVTTIGYMAFYGYAGKAIINCNIPDRTSGNDYHDVFYGAKFTEVIIGDNVTTIGYRAFYQCSSLTSVTIGDSVTTIGNETFYNCDSLTSVTIGDSVMTIGNSAFLGCRRLTSVTIGDSVTTIGDQAFYDCRSLTSVTIPDSVTTIGSRTFYYCTSLTSVTIPDSVTLIGYEAFRDCSWMQNITIGSGVTAIGINAFYGCAGKAIINCNIPDGTYVEESTYYDVFYGAKFTEVIIGNSVTKIGNYAFYNCGSLTSVTIPDSVTSIGDYAFHSCSSLTSVTIPDSVTTIGGRAFWSCDSLTSVTIGDSVTTIGGRAFGGCSSLTSVTIPDSVTTIGDEAFAYCGSLTSVYCEAITPPSLGDSAFSFNASGRAIYVPAESVEAYKAAKNWSRYSYIVGYNFE